jgi:DNA helicase-2/ATP-dependent DNA helicase PcrA
LNEQEEAAWVAKHIAARGPKSKDCVVFAWAGRLLEGVAQELRNVGLTPYLAKKRNDLDTPPVRVVIQALRLAATRADREILRQLCVAWSRLTEETLDVEEVVALATTEGGDYLRGWSDAVAQRLEERPDWPEFNQVEGLHRQIRGTLVDGLDPAKLINGFLETAHATWAARFGEDLREELEIWQSLPIPPPTPRDLSAYLQAMDLTPKVSPRPPGSIPCFTVRAKGLGFDHVYLIGMAQEVFPSFQALKSPRRERALEEERRSCFVAITRAQETLTITWARRYNGWAKAPSMFLAEMFGRGPEDEGA